MARHLFTCLTCSILTSPVGHLGLVARALFLTLTRKQKSDCACEAVVLTLWSALPIDLHRAVSIDAAKKQLKTHLFTMTIVLPYAV